jgi:hypothetical protein
MGRLDVKPMLQRMVLSGRRLRHQRYHWERLAQVDWHCRRQLSQRSLCQRLLLRGR